MPVEKNQKLTLIDFPEAGVNTNLDPAQKIEGETTITVSCESPTCSNKISWVVEQAGKDADSLPDDAYRILILEAFGGQKAVFCSWDCMRRAMKSYVAPLSPREQAEIEKNNEAVEEKKKAAVNLAAAVVHNPEAVSQPDGFSGETTTNE